MLEIPHEGRRIQKTDGGNSQTLKRTHALLDYQFWEREGACVRGVLDFTKRFG